MGAGSSLFKPKKDSSIKLCQKIKFDTGKFLMKTQINYGKGDGNGATYMSCDETGTLTGKHTEYEPELWRILYEDNVGPGKPLTFRIANSGRNRILSADPDLVCSLFEESMPSQPSQLFFFEFADSKSLENSVSEVPYLIKSQQIGRFLCQNVSGQVSLLSSEGKDEALGETTWFMIPSF